MFCSLNINNQVCTPNSVLTVICLNRFNYNRLAAPNLSGVTRLCRRRCGETEQNDFGF